MSVGLIWELRRLIYRSFRHWHKWIFPQVQRWYVRHNTSSTIELRQEEVEALGNRIYNAIQNDEGYISAAILARFDDHQTFPRLPFEPISEEYEQLVKEEQRDAKQMISALLSRYDSGYLVEAGPGGCDSKMYVT